MQTGNQNTGRYMENDENVLDLKEMMEDYVRCIKKYPLILLAIFVLTAIFAAGIQKVTYKPVYQSKIAYAIDKTEDTTIDSSIAARLCEALPTVTSMKEFRKDLQKESEVKLKKGSYSITASFTEETNFFLVTICAQQQKVSNAVMEAFKKVYPEWADASTGRLELQIMDESAAGDIPQNPLGLVKLLFISILAGAGVCILLMTVYVLNLKTVRRESDMQKVTDKSCIAAIPDVKRKKRSKSTKERLLISNRRIDWGFKQSVLAAQTRLEKKMRENGHKVLLVGSTVPQEGKSIITVNLALAFSQNGKKALILEGDFRNPSIGKILGIEEPVKGMTDYFTGNCQVDEMIVQKGEVDIITSGGSRSELSSLIVDEKMKELLAELEERYDYILIDTPPSYLFSDAAILLHYAQEAVYVVAYDFAELPEIRSGISACVQSGKLLGYLLNRNPEGYSTYGKYGYSQYGTYGKYGKYRKYRHYSEDTKETLNTEDSL